MHGNVNKVITSLKERPYKKHYSKAAMPMKQIILVSCMLTNLEAWINLTKTDIEELEKNRHYPTEESLGHNWKLKQMLPTTRTRNNTSKVCDSAKNN